jgi:hypothetical protein
MMLDEIGAYLATGGVGTVGTNIFKGVMPDVPVVQVGLFEDAGLGSIDASGGVAAERPRLRVVIRGPASGYLTARTTAGTIHTLLNRVGGLTLTGIKYHFIKALGPPQGAGRDANNNVLVVVNFNIAKEPS